MLIRYSADDKGRPIKKALIYTKDEHGITQDKIEDKEDFSQFSYYR